MSIRNAQQLVDHFIQALRRYERDGSREALDSLVDLFAEPCHASNLVSHRPREGKEGARSFWIDYRSAFREVHSHFTHVCVADRMATLEWRSEGTLRSGKPVAYRGVSVLELSEPGKIVGIARFQAYYDTAALIDPSRSDGFEADVSSAA